MTDVLNRMRSKEDYTDQHVDSRTQSKMHNMKNLSVQNLLFTLHDTTFN
jgi:hypothetical protein